MIFFWYIFLICYFGTAQGIDYYYETDKGYETELSNETLTRKIREKLRLGWSEFWFQYVSVEVNHGVATLQGTVPTWEDKDTVESIVKNNNGIIKVISRLRVQPLSYKEKQKTFPTDYAATDDDEKLNRKIRNQIERLLLGSNMRDVHFNTSSGRVIIEGLIENLRDQEKLVTEIRKIQGVTSVTSHLTNKNLQERQTQN